MSQIIRQKQQIFILVLELGMFMFCGLWFFIYFASLLLSPLGRLFCLLFVLITIWWLILIIWEFSKKVNLIKCKIYLAILFFIIIFTGLLGQELAKRYYQFGTIYVHDGIVQTELAAERLLSGENFYSLDYKDTVVEIWNHGIIEVFDGAVKNPALYHYVYLPAYVILATPFYYLGKILPIFDLRILLYLCLILVMILSRKFILKERHYLFFVLLFFLVPWSIDTWLWGLNDICLLFFILLALFLLRQKKYLLATILVALACGTKQTAWFLLPFYFCYILDQERRNYRQTFKLLLLFAVVITMIILPFYLWDSSAFIDDTILYLSGRAENSYPISGLGLGQWLVIGGVVNSTQYFPFWFWQLIIGLPILIFLLKKQRQYCNNLGVMVIAYALFLGVVWFLSRYFTWTHMVFIYQLLLLGIFMSMDNKEFLEQERPRLVLKK